MQSSIGTRTGRKSGWLRRRGGDMPERRVLVQPGHNSFPDMSAFLVEQLGFELLQLSDYDSHLGKTKLAHLRGLARQSIELLAALPRLRGCRAIVTIGPVSHGHFLKLLKRLRLIDYGRQITLGFYIHSPRFFPLLRLLSRLDSDDDHYILFSDWEIELYRRHLGIDARRMHCLPYGEWGSAPPTETEPALPDDLRRTGYYFAGGYSNRDYLPLIEVFRESSARLVIIASAVNKELDGVALPPNITLLRDVPSALFEAYLRHSKACIVPLKEDTGASGQSVILRAMRHGAPVVAQDFGAVRGYIEDGVSGYLVSDMREELPAIVAAIERGAADAGRRAEAARERYHDCFSPAAGRAALARIMAPLVAPVAVAGADAADMLLRDKRVGGGR